MVATVGGGRTIGQDLGAAGSCLSRFTTMPYMFCDTHNICNYAQNNDDSLWLSTAEPMTKSMAPIEGRDLQIYISRCQVCETTTRVIAVHSQSMELPDCPQDWEELWVGYSYYMVSGVISGSGRKMRL